MIKEKNPNNLLNASEEIVVPDFNIHQDNMEDHPPNSYNPNPEYPYPNFNQDQQVYIEPNNAFFNQDHANMYGQEDDRLNLDQYQQCQHYQDNPEDNGHNYNQISDHYYGQDYESQHHQEQRNLHKYDQDYTQPYSAHDNLGYIQN